MNIRSTEKRKSYFLPIRNGELNVGWKEIDEQDDKDCVKEYALNRVSLFSESIEKAEYSADTYLLTSNAGAIIALLGVIQRVPTILTQLSIRIALGSFLVALMSLTVVKLFRILRLYFQRGEWVKNCSNFFDGDIKLNELLLRDAAAWRYPKMTIIAFAILSYWASIFGSLAAGYGFFYFPWDTISK